MFFHLQSFLKKPPEITAEEIGEKLVLSDQINSFNVIKGFLNIEIIEKFWLDQFSKASLNEYFGFVEPKDDSPLHLVEYSSPNTNKPLHSRPFEKSFLRILNIRNFKSLWKKK